ncbi:biopolymer transporter TonB [Erythrobacter litoralis]|uniref:TonB protein n=1 Tax=Erythrobacter litoralis (strain HTCC2594) TaxID=314225 RepID=Q2N8J7_ERYLH|nr:biopolymer transporter TonB [Erythrobacter litoralis]ABC63994.1 TonB protein [Erythrobacter litoralis HTCC2594]
MNAPALRREEGLGLGVAVVLHLLLVAALFLQPSTRELVEQPERVTVNLSEEVGLTAEAPDPVPESRAAIAPILDTLPTPPLPVPVPMPIPQPRPEPTTRPEPRPEPITRPEPRPTARATSAPRQPTPRRTQAPRPQPTQSSAPPRGSRLGDDFLSGQGSSTTTQETRVPASQIGASARASLVQAIAREIKPHWQPPSGPEVEEIVTVLRFSLNEDGSLAGRPSVVRQTGVNEINRAQAERHGELAIRAVQRAAPFDLPPEYYNAWRNISAFSFDWKLSQ